MRQNNEERNQADIPVSAGELSALIMNLLTNPRLDGIKIDEKLLADEEFQRLYSMILDLRMLAGSLSRGDLSRLAVSRGYLISSLKALQNNLKHIKWLTERVSEGDFSQRANNFGEVSDAFNQMLVDMRDSRLRLTELAQIDSLTGLPNRRSLERFFSDAFSKARETNTELCTLMIDVDFFKEVNDGFGHQGGDQALIQIATIMKRYFRSCDMLARYGGEEFIAVLPGCSQEDGKNVAERVRQGAERASFYPAEGQAHPLTISVGVACIKPSDRSYSNIIARADEAMYGAKSMGRNQVCVSD